MIYLHKYRPVIYIIHGAFHQPAHFAPLISKFKENGYEAICHQNLSSSHPPASVRTADSPQSQVTARDDAMAHRKIIADIVERETRAVYIVCHSYGGLVTSELVTEDITASKRAAQGLGGGVIGLCYLSACLIPKGSSMGEWVAPEDLDNGPIPISHTDDTTGLMYSHPGAQFYFYNDMEQSDVDYYTSLLCPQTDVYRLNGPITAAPWTFCPTTYYYCTEDNALNIDFQKKMVRRAQEEASINEMEISAGHSPYLSQVSKTVDGIISAVHWSTGAN